MTAKTHFIGGHRIQEVSGDSPPDDPLDREEVFNNTPSTARTASSKTSDSSTNNSAKAAGRFPPHPIKKSGNKKKDVPVGDSRSGASSVKKKPRRVVARKTIGSVFHESDSDFEDNGDLDYTSSHSDDSGEASDIEKKPKGKPAADSGLSGGAKQKTAPASDGVKRKRGPGRPVGSVSKNKGKAPERMSQRPQKKNVARGSRTEPSDARSEAARSSSMASTSSAVKRGAPSETSVSPAKRAVKDLVSSKKDDTRVNQLRKATPVRPSPEIHAPSSSTAASPGAATSSKPAIVDDASFSGRRAKRTSATAWSQQAREYIADKPENVKILVAEKPVVSWDYSDVASFIGSVVELDHLAVMMLTEQIDGQCLLLFDHLTWQKGFGVKIGKAVRIVQEAKTLQRLQKKDFLRQWYEDRPKLFATALENLAAGSS